MNVTLLLGYPAAKFLRDQTVLWANWKLPPLDRGGVLRIRQFPLSLVDGVPTSAPEEDEEERND